MANVLVDSVALNSRNRGADIKSGKPPARMWERCSLRRVDSKTPRLRVWFSDLSTDCDDWLHYRFSVSHRDVEESLAERGVQVSYEAIRLWCHKFDPLLASELRRRQLRRGDQWFLDEMALIAGARSLALSDLKYRQVVQLKVARDLYRDQVARKTAKDGLTAGVTSPLLQHFRYATNHVGTELAAVHSRNARAGWRNYTSWTVASQVTDQVGALRLAPASVLKVRVGR